MVFVLCHFMSLYGFMNKHNLSSRSFDDWPDELVKEYLIDINHMITFRRLEDRSVVGVVLLTTTISICTGIDPINLFQYRWCFRDADEAKFFYQNIKELDEVPHVDHRKSLVGHRYTTAPLLMEYCKFGTPKW